MEVEKFVQQMEETFGQETPLTVSRGQVTRLPWHDIGLPHKRGSADKHGTLY